MASSKKSRGRIPNVFSPSDSFNKDNNSRNLLQNGTDQSFYGGVEASGLMPAARSTSFGHLHPRSVSSGPFSSPSRNSMKSQRSMGNSVKLVPVATTVNANGESERDSSAEEFPTHEAVVVPALPSASDDHLHQGDFRGPSDTVVQQNRTSYRFMWELIGFHQLTWQQRVMVTGMMVASPITLYIYDQFKGLIHSLVAILQTMALVTMRSWIPSQLFRHVQSARQSFAAQEQQIFDGISSGIASYRALTSAVGVYLDPSPFMQLALESLENAVADAIAEQGERVLTKKLIQLLGACALGVALSFSVDSNTDALDNMLLYVWRYGLLYMEQLLLHGNLMLPPDADADADADAGEAREKTMRSSPLCDGVGAEHGPMGGAPHFVTKTGMLVQRVSNSMAAMKYRSFRFGEEAMQRFPKRLTGVLRGGYQRSVHKIRAMPLMLKYFCCITVLAVVLRWIFYHCVVQLMRLASLAAAYLMQNVLPFVTSVIFTVVVVSMIVKVLQWVMKRRAAHRKTVRALVMLARALLNAHGRAYPVLYIFEEVKEAIEAAPFRQQQQQQQQQRYDSSSSLATPVGAVNFLASPVAVAVAATTARELLAREVPRSLLQRLFSFVFWPFGSRKKSSSAGDGSSCGGDEAGGNIGASAAVVAAAQEAYAAMRAGGYRLTQSKCNLWNAVQSEIERDARIQRLELIVDGGRQKCWRLLRGTTAAQF